MVDARGGGEVAGGQLGPGLEAEVTENATQPDVAANLDALELSDAATA